MPLNLLLNPTSTGEVFASTYDAIEKGITPKTLLPSSHNFREFWTDHLRALSQPGIYDTVIDALVALTQGDPSWRSNTNVKGIVARRGEMRQLFQQHPPDIVVVSGMDGLGYGFHHRNSSFWQFIHISEVYINLWKDAERSSEKGLALTVLIASAIDHEIGHWIYTLKAGFFSLELSESAADHSGSIHPENDSERNVLTGSQLAIDQLVYNSNKHTPNLKKLGVEWKTDSGEAGDFVEARSRGGIVGYLKQFHKAFIRTGKEDEDMHILPLSYLKTYLEKSPPTLHFVPPGSESMKMKNSFFPQIADNLDCAQPSSSSSGSQAIVIEPRWHCENRMRSGILIREQIRQRRLEEGLPVDSD